MRLLLTVASLSAATRRLARCGPIVAAGVRPQQPIAELAPQLYAELNEVAFGSVLPPDLPLRWNGRLRRTAGRCVFLLKPPTPSATPSQQLLNDDEPPRNGDVERRRRAEIELSPRVLDSPSRLRETLAHEMCHAAQWLVDGEARPPHGASFWRWARQVEERVPDLNVTTRHSYAIHCRFRYSCEKCGTTFGRHRRFDVGSRRCGSCGGRIRFDGEADRNGEELRPTRTVSKRDPPPFARFVAEEFGELRRRWPHASHARLMQTLSNKWHRKPRKARTDVTPARRNKAR
jgi:predicted SprT family Zn-dependent metalloprotease